MDEFSKWLQGDQEYNAGLKLLMKAGIDPEHFQKLKSGATELNIKLLKELISMKTTETNVEIKTICSNCKPHELTVLTRHRNRLYKMVNYYNHKPKGDRAGVRHKLSKLRKEIKIINGQIKKLRNG